MDHGSRPPRYFSCSTLNGRLYLHHFGADIIYRTAEDVDAIFNPAGTGSFTPSRTWTRSCALPPHGRSPFGMLFLAEGLEDEARDQPSSNPRRRPC
jgi:hypothetical protein